MSSEPLEFRGTPRPVLLREPRRRSGSASRARSGPRPSAPLPRLDEPGQPTLDYPLPRFGWEPWLGGRDTQSGAHAYAAWLNEIAADRLATIVPLLAEAGAPVARLREDPATLADVGAWVQRAFSVLAAPEIELGFLTDQPSYGSVGPTGRPARARRPTRGTWTRWSGAWLTTWADRGRLRQHRYFWLAATSRAPRLQHLLDSSPSQTSKHYEE